MPTCCLLRRGSVTALLGALAPAKLRTPRGGPEDPEKDSGQDVRILPVVVDPRGTRARGFDHAVRDMREDPMADFPIEGPRTMHWLSLEMARSGMPPVQRHHWWRQTLGVNSADPGVDEHLFLCELVRLGIRPA